MKYAPTIAELVTADGVSAKDLVDSAVWTVHSQGTDAPRFDVARAYIGVGYAERYGWAFVHSHDRSGDATSCGIDSFNVFVSEAKAFQRQAELYLAAAVEMTKNAAARAGGAA